MEMADEPELQYVKDHLPLSGGFLDAEIPFSSVHDLLLSNSQLDFNAFDIFNFESRELSPTWQTDTSSSTDSLSDNSAAILIAEGNGISPMLEATWPQEDRLCQNPQGCCISVATGILSSTHADSSSCILGMSAQGSGRQPQLSRAADAILSMNQAALRAVLSVVQCSCYRRPQVLLIVTVICSEITAWYRHVVDLYSHRRNSTAGSAVLPRPDFFIGNHRLGKDVGTALIRQILSGMLHELQAVIGDIACHAGQSAAVNEPSDLMLSNVRARMVAFLHAQLRALTSALDHSESDSGTVNV